MPDNTTSRAPSRAARVRSLAVALGASRRPTGRARAPEFKGAATAAAKRRAATVAATVAATGVGKDAAAKELAAQATALEDAIRDLSQRLILTPDTEKKREILEQQRLLHEALLKILAQQVRDAFNQNEVKEALERLAGITEDLKNEAKVLKTATNFVKRTAAIVGFVEQGIGLLAGAGLLA